MGKFRWLAILMGITIAGITGFQLYWLKDNYAREKQNLEIKTNAAFRQTILRLQSSKIKLESVSIRVDSMESEPLFRPKRRKGDVMMRTLPGRNEPVITMMNILQEKFKTAADSLPEKAGTIVISGVPRDSAGWSPASSIRIRAAMDSVRTTNRVAPFAFPGPLDSIIDPKNIQSVNVLKDSISRRIVINYIRSDSGTNLRRPAFAQPGSVGEGFPAGTGAMPGVYDAQVDGPQRVFAHKTARANAAGDKQPEPNGVFQLLYTVDSISKRDSVTIQEITEALQKRLQEDKMDVGFRVARVDSADMNSSEPNQVTIGLSSPATFSLNLLGETRYIMGILKLPILFSLLLVGITVASFILLYRSLLRQHRLTRMKNDLISNITHELKTPIATVGVAIEALKNFNAIQDQKRTSEYLDISQNELQRLGLLVDKVLKLSMFENRQMVITPELLNLGGVVNEVINSLRLQAEKQHADIEVNFEGDLSIRGDRMHLQSVVFNLLDNALKYSRDNVKISVDVKEDGDNLLLRVSDNGIGIPQHYQKKIFDKFFRVPAGDTHNAKGHGLGLSYVSQVIRQHNGAMQVESNEGEGSIFTVRLPKNLSQE